MMPKCPYCEAPVMLSKQPQTREHFLKDMDKYVCSAGHEFEAKIPLKLHQLGHGIRADL